MHTIFEVIIYLIAVGLGISIGIRYQEEIKELIRYLKDKIKNI